jgi:phospholipid/cholesterol/gamma-HCH transport system substrate-binding protein
LNTETGPFANSIKNVNSVTENLRKNNDSITAVISNAKTLTRKLSDLDLKQTLDSLDATIAFMKTSVGRITNNDGTLGKLINEKDLYERLNKAILSFEILADEIRRHPNR